MAQYPKTFEPKTTVVSALLVGDAAWDNDSPYVGRGVEISKSGFVAQLDDDAAFEVMSQGNGRILLRGEGDILLETDGNGDIRFTAHSGAISVNTWTDQSLVGFAKASIVGALNELKAEIGAAGGGGLSWEVLTTAGTTVAEDGKGYLIDSTAGNIFLSLPPGPDIEGVTVGVQVYNSPNRVTVGRNMSLMEKGFDDVPMLTGDAFTFVWTTTSTGWVRVASAGGKISTYANNETKTLDTFSNYPDGAVKYEYYIASGANMRTGTIRVLWDQSEGTVDMDESSTADIGDTSDFTFSVDVDTSMIRLRGTMTSSYSIIRLVKTTI